MNRARRAFAAIFATLAGLVLGAATAHAQETLFPRPAELEPQVKFWTRVYTEVDTHSGFIHDDLRMDVVYQTIKVPDDLSSRERRRRVERSVQTYRDIVAKLGTGARQNLNAEEQRVLALFPEGVSNAELKAAAQRVRFQLGQSDRFRAGLIRSGTWKPYIYEALAKQGLPRELAALPHVESSFDPTAYSKVGAAGHVAVHALDRRALHADRPHRRRAPRSVPCDRRRRAPARGELQQRRDLAARADGVQPRRRGHAARGRAAEDQRHRRRSCASTRAARSSSRRATSTPRSSRRSRSTRIPSSTSRESRSTRRRTRASSIVPDFMTPDTLADALNLREGALRELNPALADSVWSGDKLVPKGFKLRVPRDTFAVAEELLAAIDAKERFASAAPGSAAPRAARRHAVADRGRVSREPRGADARERARREGHDPRRAS